MECPYKIPFSTSELPNSVGEFWIYDANHRALFNVDTKEQADYIVQAINNHKLLIELAEDLDSGLRYLREVNHVPYGFGYVDYKKTIEHLNHIDNCLAIMQNDIDSSVPLSLHRIRAYIKQALKAEKE